MSEQICHGCGCAQNVEKRYVHWFHESCWLSYKKALEEIDGLNNDAISNLRSDLERQLEEQLGNVKANIKRDLDKQIQGFQATREMAAQSGGLAERSLFFHAEDIEKTQFSPTFPTELLLIADNRRLSRSLITPGLLNEKRLRLVVAIIGLEDHKEEL